LPDEDNEKGVSDDDARVSIRRSNPAVPEPGTLDARFYHGGILPQEFALNFVTIPQE